MSDEPETAGQGARRTVAVVPHTHWDREWYLPFQAFRLRLVELLDDLLPHLEADPGYAHFLLDGQLAVVDDYLAVRPERRGRSSAGSSTAGRISVGPWYTLPDEFLVSGETLVRNLQLGIERAAPLGGAMRGRLPARHVRPRRPDAPAAAPVRHRRRRRVAGRARGRRPHRVPLGRARRLARCGPSTCRPATATAPACRRDADALVAQVDEFAEPPRRACSTAARCCG